MLNPSENEVCLIVLNVHLWCTLNLKKYKKAVLADNITLIKDYNESTLS